MFRQSKLCQRFRCRYSFFNRTSDRYLVFGDQVGSVYPGRGTGHIKEEARLNKQISEDVIKSGGDARTFQECGSTLRDFADKVAVALPAGYNELPRNPSVQEMLEKLEKKKIYPLYRFLAAYVHGGHASTWLYRRHLGTYMEIGEFITTADWSLPLKASWSSVHFLGEYILEHLGASEPQFVSPEEASAIDSAFNLLDSTGSRTAR